MSKKFCSILLIVTMLLTLVPLGAWAEEVTADTAADELLQNTVDTATNTTLISETVEDEGISLYTSASGSSISVDKSTAKANAVDTLEFILDLDADLTEDQKIAVFAERNGSLSDCDIVSLERPSESAPGQTGYLLLDTSSGVKTGETTIYVSSKTTGTVTMKAYVVKGADDSMSIAQIYNGDNSIIKTAFVGNGCTGKFNTINGAVEMTCVITNAEGAEIHRMSDGDVYNGGVYANDGVDYYKVNLILTRGPSILAGETINLSVDKSGAYLDKSEDVTDVKGTATFKVSANKPGTYTVTAEYGGYIESYRFVFAATGISNVRINNVTTEILPVDNTKIAAFTVTAYDYFGNELPASNEICSVLNKSFRAQVIKAPADSALEDVELDFNYNTRICEDINVSFTPDAAGEYQIKVYNEVTGTSDTAVLRAAQFGEIDHALISYAADTYPIGEKTPNGIVKVVDKDGVVTNAAMKQFSYTGDGVAAFDSANGNITFTNDKAYVGEKVTVKVVVNNNYTAETTLTIADRPSTLEFAPVRATAGEETTVALQVLDKNGNATAIGNPNAYAIEVQSAVVTAKPSGAKAYVNADYPIDNAARFLKTGQSKITVFSDTAGTIKADVVLKLTSKDNYENSFFLTGTLAAEFVSAEAPTITQDLPESKTAGSNGGDTSLVDLDITAERGVNYQWQFTNALVSDWKDIDIDTYPSAATAHLSEQMSNSIATKYRCLVSNEYGSIYSKVCTVKFIALPEITTDVPQTLVVTADSDGNWPIALKVEAKRAVNYQWQFYNEAYGGWNDINTDTYPSAASADFAENMPANITKYRCKVSGDGGSVYSAECMVSAADTELRTAAVQFSVEPGAVAKGTKVTLTTTTAGAVIYYTTDGSAPDKNANRYQKPLTIYNDMTLKAIAVSDGLQDSTVSTAEYTILQDDQAAITIGAVTAHAGDEITVPISLKNNPGLVNMRLYVHYDSTVLTLTEVKDGGLLGEQMHSNNLALEPYVLYWTNGDAQENLTANGEIVSLKFKAAEDAALGYYPISVTYDAQEWDIVDKELQKVEFAPISGGVTISDILCGDVNGDGKVNPLDNIYLARYLADWSGYEEKIDLLAADVNGDGKVNPLDKIILARHLADWQGYETLPYTK